MFRKAAVAALVLAGGAIAHAAPASLGAYAGGSIGGTRADVDCTGTTTCDRTSVAGKIYGGYKFTDNWAVEGLYFRNGKVTGTAPSPVGPVNGVAKADGFGAGLAWHQPIDSQWDLVGRLGVARHRVRAEASAPTGRSASTTGRSNDPYLGAALGFKVAPNVTLDASWDFTVLSTKFRDANARLLPATSYRANVNTLSAGLRVDF